MKCCVFSKAVFLALIAGAAHNVAFANGWSDDESVVYDGIHYSVVDAENTAETHWALFPLIRTGAPKRAYSIEGKHQSCFYDKSDNYESLGSLIVPDSVGGKYAVTAIGNYSFNNSGITRVKLGANVNILGEAAFIWNENLTSIDWNGKVATIGDFCFRRCTALTSATLPASVKELGYGCFSECFNLAEFASGDGVESIRYITFEACKKLATVNIGARVKEITGAAFWGCEALRSINISPANSHFSFADGVLINNDHKSVVEVFAPGAICRIPDGVEEIQEFALCYHDEIESMEIPASVVKIGYYAISECPNLTSLHVKATTPPEVLSEVGAFFNVASHCRLLVPAGSLDLYKAAPVWKDFMEIVEVEPSAMEDVQATEIAADSNVYDLNGRLVKPHATTLEGLPQGLYIHKGKKVSK
ncbi:MAG: leucine-rich repeat protein [Bacteroidales bacterium]|nr:leucine-rich repeat protein [Bacteroidales bacterium]